MKPGDAREALLIIEPEVAAAAEALARVPGFHSVRISARFKDEDGRKGVDIVLDSEGNLAVQPQTFGAGARGERS